MMKLILISSFFSAMIIYSINNLIKKLSKINKERKETTLKKIKIVSRIIYVIKEYKELKEGIGFCKAFSIACTIEQLQEFYDSKEILIEDRMLSFLPEIEKFKPYEFMLPFSNCYWFAPNEYETRLYILDNILNELNNQLKK